LTVRRRVSINDFLGQDNALSTDVINFLAFDVAAILANGLERQADGPTLAVENGTVKGTLGNVDPGFPTIKHDTFERGMLLHEIKYGNPANAKGPGNRCHIAA
jgi:hypothetical protein